MLKLSCLAQTALGTVVKPTVQCGCKREQETREANEPKKPQKNQNKTLVHGRFLFPLHHRDNVSCFYQPVYVCTCNIFHAVTSFSSLSSLLSVNFTNFYLTALKSSAVNCHKTTSLSPVFRIFQYIQ